MTKKEPQMMICNRANGCGWADCGDRIPHLQDNICKDKCKLLTDAICIPYSPESQPEPTCPDCGHLWSEHGKDGGCTQRDACACQLLTPADQPKHCTKGHTLPLIAQACMNMLCKDYLPDDRGKCINFEQPQQMPLREQFEDACMYYGCCPYDDLLDRLEAIVQAHDSAVMAEFAEKLTEGRGLYMPVDKALQEKIKIIREHDSEYVGTPTELEDELVIALKAHIRAMAKE